MRRFILPSISSFTNLGVRRIGEGEKKKKNALQRRHANRNMILALSWMLINSLRLSKECVAVRLGRLTALVIPRHLVKVKKMRSDEFSSARGPAKKLARPGSSLLTAGIRAPPPWTRHAKRWKRPRPNERTQGGRGGGKVLIINSFKLFFDWKRGSGYSWVLATVWKIFQEVILCGTVWCSIHSWHRPKCSDPGEYRKTIHLSVPNDHIQETTSAICQPIILWHTRVKIQSRWWLASQRTLLSR